jgi:hypothetical protein
VASWRRPDASPEVMLDTYRTWPLRAQTMAPVVAVILVLAGTASSSPGAVRSLGG